MPVFRVTGHLWPNRHLDIPDSFKSRIRTKEFGPATVEVLVKNGEVNAIVYVDDLRSRDHLNLIFQIGRDHTIGVVNTWALSTGIAHKVLMCHVVEDERLMHTVELRSKAVAQICNSLFNDDKVFRKIIALVNGDSISFAILNHLISVFSVPHGSIMGCALATEAVRYAIMPEKKKTKLAWKETQRRLNLSEDYLSEIIAFLRDARHGCFDHVPSKDVEKILVKSCETVSRYFAYKLRGGVEPLPLSDFPVL